MVLDRRTMLEIAQALLRARDEKDGVISSKVSHKPARYLAMEATASQCLEEWDFPPHHSRA